MVTTVEHDEVITDPGEVTSRIPEPVRGNEPAPQCGGQQTTTWLAKRLWVATFDLGLSDLLPDNWAIPTADGLSFNPVALRQADRLVRALEDLSRNHEPKRPAPGPGQLTLFQDGS